MTISPVELIVAWALTGAVAAALTGCAMPRGERPTSPWHTVVQALTTAMLFAALAWRVGPRMALFAPSWLAATGVALAATDLRTRQLPNRLVLPSYLAIPSLAALTALTGTQPGALIRATLGMAAVLTFYALLYTVFPGHLGGGDLKISGPIGFLLAWQGWSALVTGTVLTWLFAALALPLSTTTPPRTVAPSLPLGPFLIGAALATTLLLSWDPSTAPSH
jgi:leader peptidase (prepilin peptidase) / N-methyltransferase